MTSGFWFLMVDDPPRKDDTPETDRAKALAAGEQLAAMLRERGEDVTFDGVRS